VFLRGIVPYTIQHAAHHVFARQTFNDIASILQKISNGTQFSPAHKLSSFNPEIQTLSLKLHSSLLSAFASLPTASEDEDCAAPPAPAIALDTLASRTSDIRLFCSVLSQSAAAHKSHAFSSATPLHAALTRCAGLSPHPSHPPPAVPHWDFVSGVLKNHPNLALTYEHFFPNISESGTSVETATIVLLLGNFTPNYHCCLTLAFVFAPRFSLSFVTPRPPPPILQALPPQPSAPPLLAPADPPA
jgi:hypothetical protein